MALKMLILALATSLGAFVSAAPTEHTLPTKTPIFQASRKFPAASTVAHASFFYEHIPAEEPLPTANLSILFVAEEASKETHRNFSKAESHASALKSRALPVKKILEALQECFEKLKTADALSAKTTIEIKLANRKNSVVAHFLFTKNTRDAISATVTLYGHAEKVPQPILNLFKAVILDDTILQKHWGKMAALATTTTMVGLGLNYLKNLSFDGLGQDDFGMGFGEKLHSNPVKILEAHDVGNELPKSLERLGYEVTNDLDHANFSKRKLNISYELRNASKVEIDPTNQAAHIIVVTNAAVTSDKKQIKQALLNNWNVFVVGETQPNLLPKGAINIYTTEKGVHVYGVFTSPTNATVMHKFLNSKLKEACQSIIEKLYPANPASSETKLASLTPARPSKAESSSESEESVESPTPIDNLLNKTPPRTPPRPSSRTQSKTPGSRRAKETPAKTPVTQAQISRLLETLLKKLQNHGTAYTRAATSSVGIIPQGEAPARIRYFENDQKSIWLKHENSSNKYVFIHLGDGINFPTELLNSFDDWNTRAPSREKHIFIDFYNNDAGSMIAESLSEYEIIAPLDEQDVFDTTITMLAKIIIDFNGRGAGAA